MSASTARKRRNKDTDSSPRQVRGAEARARVVIECRVVEVLQNGRARIETDEGALLECRCAQSIDLGWLRSAVRLAPVDGEATVRGDRASLWAVFPGPEHAAAVPERATLVASEAIDLKCGQSTITLAKDGRLRIRGRDVLTRGSRITRVQGRSVRLN